MSKAEEFYTVNKINGSTVTLVSDEGKIVLASKGCFPTNVKEGDIFSRHWKFEKNETKSRRVNVTALGKELFL